MVLANRLGYFLCGLFLGLMLGGCATLAGPPDHPPFDSSDRVTIPTEEWVPLWDEVVSRARAEGWGNEWTTAYPPLGVYYKPSATGSAYEGFDCGNAFRCWGLRSDGRLYVVDSLDPATTAQVLAHEMLHQLLNGDSDHCSYLWARLNLAGATTCGSVSRGDHDPPEESDEEI